MKKTARQRFLRKTRALTLTISIPSMLLSEQKTGVKKSGSVMNLKRSQSVREVWRSRRSSSEACLSNNEEEVTNMPGMGEDGEGLGYRLKRSLTVSHIIDNINNFDAIFNEKCA